MLVTVFGSLSCNVSVNLQYGESGLARNTIESLSEIQYLQIPGGTGLIPGENKASTINVTLTTDDPLVELIRNFTASVTMVDSNGISKYTT